MPTVFDAVIVGGGHNGLVCAAYLARAGKRVLVLERRERVGGAAMSEEVFPGFRFSVFSYVVSLLRPEIIRDLELPRHGLHILPLESTLTPLPGGDRKALAKEFGKARSMANILAAQSAEMRARGETANRSIRRPPSTKLSTEASPGCNVADHRRDSPDAGGQEEGRQERQQEERLYVARRENEKDG